MGCDKYNQNWLTGLGLATKILYHRMTRGNLINLRKTGKRVLNLWQHQRTQYFVIYVAFLFPSSYSWALCAAIFSKLTLNFP